MIDLERTRPGHPEDDVSRGGEVGIAAGYVGDEGRLLVKVKGHGNF
jgi:hypothetical protein